LFLNSRAKETAVVPSTSQPQKTSFFVFLWRFDSILASHNMDGDLTRDGPAKKVLCSRRNFFGKRGFVGSNVWTTLA
jgi:hypothetical protein